MLSLPPELQLMVLLPVVLPLLPLMHLLLLMLVVLHLLVLPLLPLMRLLAGMTVLVLAAPTLQGMYSMQRQIPNCQPPPWVVLLGAVAVGMNQDTFEIKQNALTKCVPICQYVLTNTMHACRLHVKIDWRTNNVNMECLTTKFNNRSMSVAVVAGPVVVVYADNNIFRDARWLSTGLSITRARKLVHGKLPSQTSMCKHHDLEIQ